MWVKRAFFRAGKCEMVLSVCQRIGPKQDVSSSRINSAWLCAPVFANIDFKWARTVFSWTLSWPAISEVLCPLINRAATRDSARLSRSSFSSRSSQQRMKAHRTRIREAS